MDRFDRIYALHQILRKARYRVSTNRLLQELECTPTTLRDVVRQLRDQLHAPIETSRRDGGGYWYAEEKRATYELPGLWFNASELLALTACLQLLHEVEPGALEPAIEPLRDKIQALLEHRHLGAAGEWQRIRILKLAARANDPLIFRKLAEAVLSRRRLSFDYRARSNGRQSQREVSPQRLTHYRDNWYLDAFDHSRNELRVFSIDRITAPTFTEAPADDVAETTLNRELAASYGIFVGESNETAVLCFTAARAEWVADESWHPDQVSHWLPDGRYELRIPYNNPTELILDIQRYGPDVEVVAPKSLRKTVADRLQEAAAQYDPSPIPVAATPLPSPLPQGEG